MGNICFANMNSTSVVPFEFPNKRFETICVKPHIYPISDKKNNSQGMFTHSPQLHDVGLHAPIAPGPLHSYDRFEGTKRKLNNPEQKMKMMKQYLHNKNRLNQNT